MASLEEILAYKAAERSQEAEAAQGAGQITGATGGALLGMMAGIPVHRAGNAVNAAKSLLGKTQGAAAPRNPLKALKPGYRMAGGLVGMITGGLLGNAIASQAVAENPAAELLAKLQVQGTLDVADKMALEQMVGSYYKGMS